MDRPLAVVSTSLRTTFTFFLTHARCSAQRTNLVIEQKPRPPCQTQTRVSATEPKLVWVHNRSAASMRMPCGYLQYPVRTSTPLLNHDDKPGR